MAWLILQTFRMMFEFVLTLIKSKKKQTMLNVLVFNTLFKSAELITARTALF